MQQQEGIWRALPPERGKYFQRFIGDYETIRQAEGRGSTESNYYLELPFRDVTRKQAWQWRIRGKSYRCLEKQIWPLIEKQKPQGLDLLDVGAGVGWLSYRLALRGLHPTAVDLIVNDFDGLGATRHYLAALSQPFPCFQAEMDCLPFGDGQFDVVVFNASLHYSENYHRTLSEALRCLRPKGHLLIVDTPIYQLEESGKQMLEERHRQFESQYGFRSDGIPSREFLTYLALNELASQLHLTWRFFQPWYGVAWALRPFMARLQKKREPSKFHILWGQRNG